jgi:hypothetical protein
MHQTYIICGDMWKPRDLERLDQYWRQGYKTAWKLNKSTATQPWTTPKNMGAMGYNTTTTVLTHTLHAHVDRCLKTEYVACQIMKNNLKRAMRQRLCTSKAELTLEAGSPSTHQVSYSTATRQLRILRRRLEKIMGTSTRIHCLTRM